MIDPSDFLASLEWTREFASRIVWNGLNGIVQLGNGKLARLKLDTVCRDNYPTSGHYTGITVEIVHTDRGRIDRQDFLFGDHLHERSDSRSDYNNGFCIISSCGWKWYIAIPKSTRQLTFAVEQYVGLFS